MEPRAMDDDASATGEAGPRPPKRQSLGTEGPRRPKRGKYTPVACDQVRSLSDEMAQLRQQVADLVGTVKQLKDHSPRPASMALQSPDTTIVQSPSTAQKEAAPKQPQFVGPTRPSFGLLVGERSLTRMGIPTFESPPPSGAQSPAEPLREITSEAEFWHHCTPGEMARLLAVFEEVESVYPFIDIVELASRAQQILDFIRSGKSTSGEVREEMQLPVSARDVEMAKVAIATALAVEAHGKSKLSATIAETLLTMLSIYYFHCDDELLAWRTIGIAAREALEMGLHRRKSLFDNFKDPDTRRLATRVFWCVYVLDRRWSFGTSLSFALSDRDIDPGLPEPDSDFCYLVHVHSSHLRLRHPRLGLAARTQPRVLHRLRALLYLRGNHTRISVYQHYLFNTTSITANLRSAWLVVNIALDSVQILVHLNATTDIYSRQQNAFNYFLVSAMAVIFLATDPMRTDNGSSLWDAQTTSDIIPETEMSNSVPDMFQMRNDLLDIFDALGQGQHFPGEFGAHFYGPDDTDLLNGRREILDDFRD
ncbi:fungal specific transcription factor domain-containing protein [Hirsutella rhossiliensis]|uniref:Fungal specific transcription factor domain-containing protein n=1 Tax=Hirsutella rhossiliensis TaxID=111463 RepID=A0A9P8SCH2_9HYPO|nr:fungal specific transcription factor domain-containing protein [Hirsutella rhossiliensis]KAH0956899.1 fungal specific transcription factor domain-containing protein [Hirsutella rhossiliensis]